MSALALLVLVAGILVAGIALLVVSAPRRTPRDRLPPFIRDADAPIPAARRLADWRWSYDQLPPEAR